MTLTVETVGPVVSVQDAGRAGRLGLGLSPSGAAARDGYLAACALANVPVGTAAIEMAGFGGRFRLSGVESVALAGAPMRSMLNGAPVEWNALHLVEEGAVLDIGAAETGVYGYLLPGGGVKTAEELGGRGLHRIAGLGQALAAGDRLPIAPSEALERGPVRLIVPPALDGPIRVMPGPQTALFDAPTRARFEATVFRRSTRANRQGVRLEQTGAAFSAGAQLSRVSDFIAEGDIQMTGDGTPYVLLADCQTMGGYPRIGTVLPEELSRIAQSVPGQEIRFRFVTVEEATMLWRSDETVCEAVRKSLQPLVRDPHTMRDLLSYELISKPLDD